jgi:hypothetical protein
MFSKSHFSIIFLLTSSVISLFSQSKRDYKWIMGYDQVTPLNQIMLIDFSFCPLNISQIPTVNKFAMDSNTSMSDETGNLLFYSNGCSIINAIGETMENGDSINPGLIQNIYCSSGGSPYDQGVISIPAPENDSFFYVFNLDMQQPYFMVGGFLGIAPQRLLYQKIDITKAAGLKSGF